MYSTAEVAERIGVSKNTLLRWLSDGRLADVARDWRNWRCWSEADVARALAVRDALHGEERDDPNKQTGVTEYADGLAGLGAARGFRAQVPDEPSHKAAGMMVYAEDLERLGEGRSYRAG